LISNSARFITIGLIPKPELWRVFQQPAKENSQNCLTYWHRILILL